VGLYDNLFDQGWYFATQVQGVLSGDTNPADWSAAQTASVGGSVVYLVPGSGTSTVNTSTSGPDNPEQPSILQSVAGAFDWLDDPGLALLSTNGLGTAVRGSMTWNFTSTLTDGSVSCSVNWAVKLTLPYRTGRFGPVRPTPVKPGPKPPLRPVVPRGE
jgi:hypothetical protein